MVVFSNCIFRYFCCVFSEQPSASLGNNDKKKSFLTETLGHVHTDSEIEYIKNYVLNNKQQIVNHLSDVFEKSNIIHKRGFYYNMSMLHERNDIYEGKSITATFVAKCIVERNNNNNIGLSKHFLYSSINEIWSELTKYKNGEKQKKPIIVKDHDRVMEILNKYNQNNTITNTYYVAPKVENTIHVYSPGWHGFITVEDRESHEVLFFMILCANASGDILNPHLCIDIKAENKLKLETQISPLSCKDCVFTYVVNKLPVKDSDDWAFTVYGGRCEQCENQTVDNLNYITVTSKLTRATDEEMNEYFNSIMPLEISVFLDKIRKGALMLDVYREYNQHKDIGHLMNDVDLDNKIELKDYIEGYLLDIYIQHTNSNNNLWIKKPQSCPIHTITPLCPVVNNRITK